jgi:hypothetical protein
MLSAPELVPRAVGVNTVVIVQDALAATLPRQVLEAAGAVTTGLDDCTDVTVKAAFPQLLNVSV